VLVGWGYFAAKAVLALIGIKRGAKGAHPALKLIASPTALEEDAQKSHACPSSFEDDKFPPNQCVVQVGN